ncbi:MAG: thiamine phosphate synthase [Dehalococcoidales bacterium]|nr:thiamine phosphate synthase [Dehalococcoidales bacterium]
MIEIYADGAYNPLLGQGGWGAVIVEDSQKQSFSGMVIGTTSNRMEITAALEGIQRVPQGTEVVLYTDSQYLFGCVTKGWQRRANRDLWEKLDAVVSTRKISWRWIDQNAGNPFHKEAHHLATTLASQTEMTQPLPSEESEQHPQVTMPSSGEWKHPMNESLSEAISYQTLRIVDASLNRVGEGLRLLEDVARLLLDDATLTQQLKTMRHELVRSDFSLQQQLIQSRDSEGDVGINIEVSGEEKERELPLIVVANARRVQESLRTLEEMAKIRGIAAKLDSNKFKQARFQLYTLERGLLSRLLRQDKIKHMSGLYVIIDTSALRGRSHVEVAGQVIRGGARVIQLRDKLSSKKELFSIAQQLKKLCIEHNVLFIINDYLDIAMATDADGLHLGQDDMTIKVARTLLPIDKILGRSTTSLEQALLAEAEGADYIAVGSIYPTLSKTLTSTPAKVIGLETLRQIRQRTALPVVAIGGITKDNVAEVMAAGADSVAVISAVLQAESPEEAARQIIVRTEVKK